MMGCCIDLSRLLERCQGFKPKRQRAWQIAPRTKVSSLGDVQRWHIVSNLAVRLSAVPQGTAPFLFVQARLSASTGRHTLQGGAPRRATVELGSCIVIVKK